MSGEAPLLCEDYLRIWTSGADDITETHYEELVGMLNNLKILILSLFYLAPNMGSKSDKYSLCYFGQIK